jgi:hypothetical protein
VADIVYTIEYNDQTGLKTTQTILAIGSADRIRFVTTAQTANYLAKEHRKVALTPDPKFPSPFKSIKNPYLVPLETAKPVSWFKVIKRGKQHGFHFNCGSVDSSGVFEKWTQPKGAVTPHEYGQPAGPARAAQVQSLPFPD